MVDQLYTLKAALLVKPARSACSPRSHWSQPSACRVRLAALASTSLRTYQG